MNNLHETIKIEFVFDGDNDDYLYDFEEKLTRMIERYNIRSKLIEYDISLK